MAITGAGFGVTQGSSTVTFNGISAVPTSWSDGLIAVSVPTGATTGNVVVSVGGAASNGTSFTVSTGFSVTGVTPNSGNTGEAVVVSGTGFGTGQGSNTLAFNGAKATVTSWTNTSLTTTVPAAATSGPVVVTISGAASDGVNFTAQPQITGISPDPAALGANLTVTGENFGASQGSSTVSPCGGVSSWTSSQIVLSSCAQPLGALPIQVTVNGVSSTIATVTVIPDAILGSANPNPAAVGTPVLIRGKGFAAVQGQSFVTIDGAITTPTSWSDTAIVAPVPSGAAASGTLVVNVGGVPASPQVFFSVGPQSTPNSLQVTPTGVNMLIGDTQQFVAMDDQNQIRYDATWTVDNQSLATITIGSSPTLAAVAAGTVNLTATVGTVSTQMPVVISPLASFPVGTTLWSAPTTSGLASPQIAQALPTDYGPSIFSIQNTLDGNFTQIEAFTTDGRQMWQNEVNAIAGQGVPDASGGLVVTEACSAANNLPLTLAYLDPISGGQSWQLPIPTPIQNNQYICLAGTLKMAVRQDDALIVTLPLQVSPALVIVDGPTGSVIATPAIPPSTFTDEFGNTNTCDCLTPVGQPIVDSDGSAYLEYELRESQSYETSAPTVASTLWLMRIATDNTTSAVQISSSNTTNLFPGTIIPDGQGGILATWAIVPIDPSAPPIPYPYQVADVLNGQVNVYQSLGSGPVVNGTDGLPIPSTLVLGDNGVAFLSGGAVVTSFNVGSGSLNWSYQSPSQTREPIVASTDGGGVAVNDSQQGVLQLDVNGTATQVASGYSITQPTYSATGEWYAASVSGSTVSAVVLPLSVDAASLWTTPDGSGSQNGLAGTLCPCLFQTTDEANGGQSGDSAQAPLRSQAVQANPDTSSAQVAYSPEDCPTCALQSPNCQTMVGLPPTYLILVGDPGLNNGPGHNHNLGNLLNYAALQKAYDLNKQGFGNWVVVCRVSSIQDFNAALTEVAPGEIIPGQITGGVYYYGHAAYLQDIMAGVVTNEHSILAVGQGTGQSTNISDSNVNMLQNIELGPNATITLNGCNAAAKTPGYHRPSIAQLISLQLHRTVFAYDVGVYFSHQDADHDQHFNGLDLVNGQEVARQVSSGLPMYAIPEGYIGAKPNPRQFPH